MAQIRIDEMSAQRLIAQRLRANGVSPSNANNMAEEITHGLVAATPELSPTSKSS